MTRKIRKQTLKGLTYDQSKAEYVRAMLLMLALHTLLTAPRKTLAEAKTFATCIGQDLSEIEVAGLAV